MQPSEAIADAESAYREGDYPRCVRTLHRLFLADLALFEGEAERYAGSVATSDRSQFWTAPEDFYPDSDLGRSVLYVAYVQALMDRHDVRSVLDLGCGDWRFSRYLDFAGRHYTGFDVVPSVVAANRAAFGAPNIRFEQADLSTHPELAACDRILCKDVLQHLSNARVSAILSKCRVARLALITNDYHPENFDCRDGETRPLDVTARPFGFSARPVLRFGRKVSFLSEHAGSMSPPNA